MKRYLMFFIFIFINIFLFSINTYGNMKSKVESYSNGNIYINYIDKLVEKNKNETSFLLNIKGNIPAYISKNPGLSQKTKDVLYYFSEKVSSVLDSNKENFNCKGNKPTGEGYRYGSDTYPKGYASYGQYWRYGGLNGYNDYCIWTCKDGYKLSGNKCIKNNSNNTTTTKPGLIKNGDNVGKCSYPEGKEVSWYSNISVGILSEGVKICEKGKIVNFRFTEGNFKWMCQGATITDYCSVKKKMREKCLGNKPHGIGVRIMNDFIGQDTSWANKKWHYRKGTGSNDMFCSWYCAYGYEQYWNTCIKKKVESTTIKTYCGEKNKKNVGILLTNTPGLCLDGSYLKNFRISSNVKVYTWECKAKDNTKTSYCSAYKTN